MSKNEFDVKEPYYKKKPYKLTKHDGVAKRMKEAYQSDETYAEALFIEITKQQLLGEELKPVNMVQEFVLIYDLFPQNIFCTTTIPNTELTKYFRKFVEQKGPNNFTEMDWVQAQSSYWRCGLRMERLRQSKGRCTKLYFINTNHKLAKLDEETK